MVVNSSMYVLCKAAEESSQHIFMTCIFAQRVWLLCLRWMGIVSVQHKDLINHFESFHLTHLTTKQNQVWKGLWVAIVRSIWDQRNLVVFKQGIPDAEEIFHSAQVVTWLCLKFGAASFRYSYSDWILNNNTCLQSYYMEEDVEIFLYIHVLYKVTVLARSGTRIAGSCSGNVVKNKKQVSSIGDINLAFVIRVGRPFAGLLQGCVG